MNEIQWIRGQDLCASYVIRVDTEVLTNALSIYIICASPFVVHVSFCQLCICHIFLFSLFFSVPIVVAINKCDRPNADPVSKIKYMHILINCSWQVVFPTLSSAESCGFQPRKFKGGICCGSHLAITYESKLLHLQNYFELSPPSNFVKLSCVELIAHAERFSCSKIHGNDNVNRLLKNDCEWMTNVEVQ